MKKFIKNIFLFLLIFIIEYFVLLCIWGFFVPIEFNKNIFFRIATKGHTFTRLKEAQKTKDIDILFIGSSHVYRGIDPRVFEEYNIDIFNMGSSSQTPIQSYYLLKKYLKMMNPKLIVFDLYPTMLSNDGVESSLDIISNDLYSNSMINLAFDTNNLRVYNTLLFAMVYDFIGKRASIKEPEKYDNELYIRGGYVESELNYYTKENITSKEWVFNEKQLEYLAKIIQLTDSLEIKTFLIQIPYTNALFNSYTNNYEVDSIFKTYGDYVNFNYICSLKDTVHFLDDDHLNQKGVRYFNEDLIEYLYENQYILYNN